MNLTSLVNRVRSYTRDTTGTLFASSDVKDFINEAIDRFKQITELEGMKSLEQDSDSPNLLPPQYHYSLAVYSASRCYSQDEQHYLAQTFMDEFTNLFSLVELGIKEGRIVIVNDDGTPVTSGLELDGVTNVYFSNVY